MRRLLVLPCVLAATLSLTALAAPAQAAPADPTRVPNVNMAALGLSDYIGHATASSARAALVGGLTHAPAFVQNASRVGPVHAGRFTFTFKGDQACGLWAPGVDRGRVVAGPCSPAERQQPSRTPLTDAATWLGQLTERAAATGHPAPLDDMLSTDLLTLLAGAGAPAGVAITGVTDGNHDGLEDDARVTFRANGKAVCAQLPIRHSGRWRLFYTGCRNLPARDMSDLRGTSTYQQFVQQSRNSALLATAKQVDKMIAAETAWRDVSEAQLTDRQVRRLLVQVRHDGVVAKRLAPAAIVVLDTRTGCSVSLTWPRNAEPGQFAQPFSVVCE